MISLASSGTVMFKPCTLGSGVEKGKNYNSRKVENRRCWAHPR